jgi:hypothetical protein
MNAFDFTRYEKNNSTRFSDRRVFTQPGSIASLSPAAYVRFALIPEDWPTGAMGQLRTQLHSFDTLADVNLGLIIRVPCQAHLVTTEFRNTNQPPRASFDKQSLRRYGRKTSVPDARGCVL